MACTVAIETEIDRHYGEQLDELGDQDSDAQGTATFDLRLQRFESATYQAHVLVNLANTYEETGLAAEALEHLAMQLTAVTGAQSGTVNLVGRIGSAPWSAALDLSTAVEGKGISKLWARSKISAIEASRYAGAKEGDVVAATAAFVLGLAIIVLVAALLIAMLGASYASLKVAHDTLQVAKAGLATGPSDDLATLAAQATAVSQISGDVTDATGAAVPGAADHSPKATRTAGTHHVTRDLWEKCDMALYHRPR